MIIKVGEKYYGIKGIEAENKNHNRIRVSIDFFSSENLLDVAGYFLRSKRDFFNAIKEFNTNNTFSENYKNLYKEKSQETNKDFNLEIIFYNEREQTEFIMNLFKDFDINNCKYSTNFLHKFKQLKGILPKSAYENYLKEKEKERLSEESKAPLIDKNSDIGD